MTLNDILNEQRIYAMINDVPILRESEVHLFEELIGLYRTRTKRQIVRKKKKKKEEIGKSEDRAMKAKKI